MSRSTVIRGGTVLTANGSVEADVLIVGGTVHAVGEIDEIPAATEVIDATGLLVIPGGVDPHTHFDWHEDDQRADDDFESAGRACLAGGITSHIDFAYQRPGGTLGEGLDEWHEKARDSSVIDYGFTPVVTEMSDAVLAEVPDLISVGYPTFKAFMVGDGWSLNDGELMRLIRTSAPLGGRVSVHAENPDIADVLAADFVADGHTDPRWHAMSRPWQSEWEATVRAIALAGAADAPLYVVHMASRYAVEELRSAQRRGDRVAGEVCVHYLTLTDDVYDSDDFDEVSRYVCSPPIRGIADQSALWSGLANGTLSVVGSDHSPFTIDERRRLGGNDFRAIPNGVGPIEHLRSLVWHFGVRTGRITPEQFVAVTATNAAHLFGMAPQKGDIVPGGDADIVLWDPDKTVEVRLDDLQSKSDHSLFEGWKLTGNAVLTMAAGEVLYAEGKVTAEPGRGRFLPRTPLPKCSPVAAGAAAEDIEES